MKVYFGSDHRGNELRPKIVDFVHELGYECEDLGMDGDFPLMAQRVSRKVNEHQENRGILICGTGQGMAIASNKCAGIRASMCNTKEDAVQSRDHLNSNILTMGAERVNESQAKEIVKTFLTTPFTGLDRYHRRIGQLENSVSFLTKSFVNY